MFEVGYYSGYLAGLFTGAAVGWILSSVFSKNREDPVGATNGDNVVYLRLTDQAFADFARGKALDNIFQVNDACDDSDSSVTAENTPNPKIDFDPNVPTDELEEMFVDEVQRQGRSVEETLDLGRKAGSVKVNFPTSASGGYLTLDQVKEMGDKFRDAQSNMLSRADELEIIHAFRGIVNMNYGDACTQVEEQGYVLHPLYIGTGTKMPYPSGYSGTVIGVRVRDPETNFTGNKYVPSTNAIVTEIIDIGGVDIHNRGVIRL